MTGSPDLCSQRGNVLVAVMVTLTLVLFLASTLINQFAVSESQAVEDSLSDTRTYWAMMGHLTFMLSRARTAGVCTGVSKLDGATLNAPSYCTLGDTDSSAAVLATVRPGLTSASRIGSMQDYLVQLQLNGTIIEPGYMRWRFPTGTDANLALNVADANYVDIRGIVRPRDNADINANTNNNDALMSLDLEVMSVDSAIPALKGLRGRFRRMTIGFCVVDQQTNVPAGIVPTSGCGTVEGESRIQFIRRDSLVP
jgi:hypothetical protein